MNFAMMEKSFNELTSNQSPFPGRKYRYNTYTQSTAAAVNLSGSINAYTMSPTPDDCV